MTKITIKPPRVISLHEMEVIKGARKKGVTHKEIKAHIDQDRKFAGTYRGKGISTNTISRLLGKTHGKSYTEKIEKAWMIHRKKTAQKSHWEEIRAKIKDPKKLKRIDKAMKRIIERTKGEQYNVLIDYDPVEDYYEFTS